MATKNRIRSIWHCIHKRCYKPITKYQKKNYYDKGITVCEEWNKNNPNGYENFRDWAYQNGYSDNLTIDRIDNSKGYCPENCRWVTKKEQANNRDDNIVVTLNGKTQTLKQWAEELNLNYSTIKKRIEYNWTFERALTEPINKNHGKEIIVNGVIYPSLVVACESLGLNYYTVKDRIYRHGYTLEEALTIPTRGNANHDKN